MTVSIPAFEEKPRETSQSTGSAATSLPAGASFAGRHVLIVGHQESVRCDLRQFLARHGFRVSEHHDSTLALGDIIRAQTSVDPYAALFLDVALPRLSGFDLVDLLRGACQNLPTFVMVLGGVARAEQTLRCQASGLTHTLGVPILEADCLAILSRWQNVPSPEAKASGSPIAPVSPVTTTFSASILLVEDNLINQHVARTMLKKLGCTVTVANNGLEAVRAIEKSSYDLVFMDIQMPEMDGLEATRAIRSLEKLSGGHVPIVTLTAHALERDRQQCFEAGVDDFLTKPVRREEILRALQRHLVADAVLPQVPVTSPPSGSHMLSLVDEDRELLGHLAGILIESTPKHLAELKVAVASADFARIQEISHKLKGSMAQLDAFAAKSAAQAIEAAAKAKDLSGVGPHLASLAAESEALLVELRPFLPVGRVEPVA